MHAAANVVPVCVFSVIVSPTSIDDAVVENDGRRPVLVLPDVRRFLYQARAPGKSGFRTRRSLSRKPSSKAVAGSSCVELLPPGTALNIGAAARACDVSGVVTVVAPIAVKATVALFANPKSLLNRTSANSPVDADVTKTQPPLIAGRTSPTARLTGLDELHRDCDGSVPFVQAEVSANSPIAIGTNAPRVRGASMDYSWIKGHTPDDSGGVS